MTIGPDCSLVCGKLFDKHWIPQADYVVLAEELRSTRGEMQRRLAAIVCADVVGYSRMMGADEAGTHAAFKAHRSAIYPVILNQAAGW